MLKFVVCSSWFVVIGFFTLYFLLPTTYATSHLGPAPAGLDQAEYIFERVLRYAAGLSFVALFIILVISGVRFLTSGGEPKAIASARDGVVWALLGILFLAIGWLVLLLVAEITGIEALKIFDIKVLTR